MQRGIVIFIILVAVFVSSCKHSPQKAEKYYYDVQDPLEKIILKEEQLIEQINSFMEQDSGEVNGYLNKYRQDTLVDYKPLDMAFQNFCLQITVSQNTLKKIPDFDKENLLKKSAEALIEAYLHLSQNEYPELIAIVKKPHNIYTFEDDQRFIELNEMIDSVLQEKIDLFAKESKKFANHYKFKLIEETY